jgi:argonaute-like protein implicated in RNA metabolism and viral defense
MGNLEQYFKHENWMKFSSLFENIPDELEMKKELLEILEDDIILANVIYQSLGKHSIKWINNKVPALDNLTPKECLKNIELKNRLKECLMRMPY